MNQEISYLLQKLDNHVEDLELIKWSCPVPSFGNLPTATIATLGLNPSNREFMDADGVEITGNKRRLPTLTYFGLDGWKDAKEEHFHSILDFCFEYFERNPYDSWFKRLDYIISGTSYSYYFPSQKACHLDLIPFATAAKWGNLTPVQQSRLLESNRETLGLLLCASDVRMLLLNGQSVVNNLEQIAGVKFTRTLMPDWALPRKESDDVLGFAYRGTIEAIGGVRLNRTIEVLGYNHNIQSSFGVTREVLDSIRNWVSLTAKELSI
jgi:hypothetical protein